MIHFAFIQIICLASYFSSGQVKCGVAHPNGQVEMNSVIYFTWNIHGTLVLIKIDSVLF